MFAHWISKRSSLWHLRHSVDGAPAPPFQTTAVPRRSQGALLPRFREEFMVRNDPRCLPSVMRSSFRAKVDSQLGLLRGVHHVMVGPDDQPPFCTKRRGARLSTSSWICHLARSSRPHDAWEVLALDEDAKHRASKEPRLHYRSLQHEITTRGHALTSVRPSSCARPSPLSAPIALLALCNGWPSFAVARKENEPRSHAV